MVQNYQVPFAHGAAHEVLNGVNCTATGVGHSSYLLTLSARPKLTQGDLRHSNADGQTRAKVPVKSNDLL